MSANNQNNRNQKSGIPWWVIILCFVFGLWPVGIVLLLLRLGQESGAFSSRRSREAYDRFADEAQRGVDVATQAARNAAERVRQSSQQASQRTESRAAAAQTKPSDPKEDRLKGLKTGKVCTVVGAIMMALFGFSTLMTFADYVSWLFYEPLWLLEEVLPPFILTGVGAGLFTWGRFKKSQRKRFRRYLTLIGDQQQVSVSALAAAYPARRDATCTTLENMIEVGIFGDRAYLDYGRDLLVLDGSGVRAEEPKRERPAPETDVGEENALLRQIRQVNDAIRNPELSRKIDRIEEITQRILEFQQEHPEKAPELRKFLNYYLPTTLKILESYAELEKQGVEGENIAATKQRIEGMMDMVVEGFERQLDKLFAGDMMDIAADITVMEQMMQGDGLFAPNGSGIGSGGENGAGGH